MNGGATYIPWVDFEPKLEGWKVLIKSPANGGVDIIEPYFNLPKNRPRIDMVTFMTLLLKVL